MDAGSTQVESRRWDRFDPHDTDEGAGYRDYLTSAAQAREVAVPKAEPPLPAPCPPIDLAKLRAGLRVRANVYHLGRWSAGLNSLVPQGAYHVGVEVCGLEWSYGMTNDPSATGVAVDEPRKNRDHVFFESIDLGITPLKRPEVQQLLEELRRTWKGANYRLLGKNCLAFAEHLLMRLQVDRLPPWCTGLSNSLEHTTKAVADAMSGVVEGFRQVGEDVSRRSSSGLAFEVWGGCAGPTLATCGPCGDPVPAAREAGKERRDSKGGPRQSSRQMPVASAWRGPAPGRLR